MTRKLALGIDYGTNSCRSLLVDLVTGEELGSAVFAYPSGEMGILTDPSDPHVARQNPMDYVQGLEAVTRGALDQARGRDPSFDPSWVLGIGIDTTGSTVIPIDREGVPLGMKPGFRENPHAQVWLWKDHTAHAEAAEITETAERMRPHYLKKCGGIYSSEWWWSKILRLRRVAPEVFAAAHGFVEHCDWIPALLTGNKDPLSWKRGICAAGHKAMFSDAWGGLPDEAFLGALHPDLASLRGRLFDKAWPATEKAGELCGEWAEKLGLREGTAVAVGAFDAHMGAVGAGITEGTLVKILGTSTCDLMIARDDGELRDIPGVCGMVPGSVLPGHVGIEAGQSAVGDIFLWLVHHLVPDSYGTDAVSRFEALEKEMAGLAPGASGLLALDWFNGNRTVLVDTRLTGLVLGQTLHTTAAELYRALIEATAFGALTIIRRVEEFGVPIREVVNTGGLSIKNPALMQIYADVIGRPMKVSRSEQTCALGAAIFGAAAAGSEKNGFRDITEIQAAVTGTRPEVYHPHPGRHAVYAELYQLYLALHDAFGTTTWTGNLHHVMKQLLSIRDRAHANQTLSPALP